jgi:ABC-2 type transport system permease protein
LDQYGRAGRHGGPAYDLELPSHEKDLELRCLVRDAILRILALTYKELLAVLKDPRSRFSIFIPPILQCLIYGYVATYDLNDVPYAVLDQDRSAASYDLLARLDGTGVFHRAANLERAADIKTWIDDTRVLLVVQIEQDFERRLLQGQGVDVQVIADGRNSNTAGIALGYVGNVIESFNTDWRAAHGQVGTPVQATIRAWYNPNLETRWHMIPSLIGTLTMIETLILMAMSVAREREEGTFDQLLVTPFRPAEIMAGKALPAMLIGIIQSTTILLVAQFWFHIPFTGSFLTLYAGLGLFLLAAVGVGLFVSSIAATMQQAMLYSFLVIMPFVLLSGLTTPISSMPQALQYCTLLNPLRYAIEIVHRVYLEGASLGSLWPELWPLAIIAAVTLSVSSWMFRHGLE